MVSLFIFKEVRIKPIISRMNFWQICNRLILHLLMLIKSDYKRN